jgi:hypothetical protein
MGGSVARQHNWFRVRGEIELKLGPKGSTASAPDAKHGFGVSSRFD